MKTANIFNKLVKDFTEIKKLFYILDNNKFLFCPRFTKKLFLSCSVVLFFGSNQTSASSASSTCRPYFIQIDVLQKFTSEEFDSLIKAAKVLGRLLGKQDSASVEAKELLNKQVLDLMTSKHLSKDESRYFMAYFSKQIKIDRPSNLHSQHETEKRQQLEQLRFLHSIFNKYGAKDLDEAFFLSSEKSTQKDDEHFRNMQFLVEAGADINYLHKAYELQAGITALHAAVRKNNLEVIQFLIDAKADLEKRNEEGVSPVMLAIMKEHREAANLLLKNGAHPNAAVGENISPLMYATTSGFVEGVKILIKYKANLDFKDAEGHTALMMSMLDNTPLMGGSTSKFVNATKIIAPLLIKAGANLDLQNNQDQSVLMMACKLIKLHPESSLTFEVLNKVIKLLIQNKANLNLKDRDNKTALYYTVQNHNLKAMQFLIDAKADLDIQDVIGNTALIQAIELKYTAAAKRLIQAGANLNLQNNSKFTAVMRAVSKKEESILKDLIRAGADLNIQNTLGITALISATRNSDLNMMKILISAGAKVDLQDYDGKTSLMIAVENNNVQGVQMLVAANANVNLRTITTKQTALLLYAANTQRKQQDPSILQLLIEAKANPFIKDIQGKTADQVTQDSKIAQILKDYKKSFKWYRAILERIIN